MLLLSAGTQWGFGQHIRFVTGSWEQVKKQAVTEGKLIFMDVYTDWCGPCKLMEEEVFTQPEVAGFYNEHFVCYQVDAEKGEGIDLKRQYEVKVYPTYLFVDPETGELVHRSTSRQDKQTFVFTGQSALNPVTRSVYLEAAYQSGNREKPLLSSYARYLSSCYQREKLDTLVTDYLATHALTDTLAWRFFTQYQQGTRTPQFERLLADRKQLEDRHGNAAVNDKLCTAFEADLLQLQSRGVYQPERYEAGRFDSLWSLVEATDFPGKAFLKAKVSVISLFRQEKYDEAADIADSLPGHPEADKVGILEFYRSLLFFTRTTESVDWIKRALTYARYIAYNDEENRSKAEIHYNYASLLERFLGSTVDQPVAVPALAEQPKFGEPTYTLRPVGLKQKPKK